MGKNYLEEWVINEDIKFGEFRIKIVPDSKIIICRLEAIDGRLHIKTYSNITKKFRNNDCLYKYILLGEVEVIKPKLKEFNFIELINWVRENNFDKEKKVFYTSVDMTKTYWLDTIINNVTELRSDEFNGAWYIYGVYEEE